MSSRRSDRIQPCMSGSSRDWHPCSSWTRSSAIGTDRATSHSNAAQACCTDGLMFTPFGPRAVLITSASADTELSIQQNSPYSGMCCFRFSVQWFTPSLLHHVNSSGKESRMMATCGNENDFSEILHERCSPSSHSRVYMFLFPCLRSEHNGNAVGHRRYQQPASLEDADLVLPWNHLIVHRCAGHPTLPHLRVLPTTVRRKQCDRDASRRALLLRSVITHDLSSLCLPKGLNSRTPTLLMASMERKCRVLSAWFIAMPGFREEGVEQCPNSLHQCPTRERLRKLQPACTEPADQVLRTKPQGTWLR